MRAKVKIKKYQNGGSNPGGPTTPEAQANPSLAPSPLSTSMQLYGFEDGPVTMRPDLLLDLLGAGELARAGYRVLKNPKATVDAVRGALRFLVEKARGGSKAVPKGVDLVKNYSKLSEVPDYKLANHLERVGPRAMSKENDMLNKALGSRVQKILDDMNLNEYMDEASYNKLLREIEDLYTPSRGGTVTPNPEDFSDAMLDKLKKYGLEPKGALPELREDLIRQMGLRASAFYNNQGGRIRVKKKNQR